MFKDEGRRGFQVFMSPFGASRLYHHQEPLHGKFWLVDSQQELILEKRGLILDSILCVMCGEEEETGSHVFFKYKVAWRVWCLCCEWVGG